MRFFGKVPFLYQKLKTSRKVYVIDTDISKQWNSPKMTYLNNRQTTSIVVICLTALLLSPLCFCIVILTNMRGSLNYQWNWNIAKDTDLENGKLTVCPGTSKGNSTQKFVILLDASSSKQNILEIRRNFPYDSLIDTPVASGNISTQPMYTGPGGRSNCSLGENPYAVKRCADMKTVRRCLMQEFGYKATKGKKLNPCFLIRVDKSRFTTSKNNSNLRVPELGTCVFGNICMGCKPRNDYDKNKFNRLRLSRGLNITSQHLQEGRGPSITFLVQVVELQPKTNLTLVCWMNYLRDGVMRTVGTVSIQLVQ